jgi:sulfonate transport system permease protein
MQISDQAIRQLIKEKSTGQFTSFNFKRMLTPWIIPFVVLSLWLFSTTSGWIDQSILPSPITVAHAAYEQWTNNTLWTDIGVSLSRVLAGFSIGMLSGLVLGTAVGLSQFNHDLLDRSLQMLRTIPHLALVPLMILWLGIDETPRILLVALGTLFPVYINTASGIKNVDAKLLEMGKSYGLSRKELIKQIIIPGAMPSILVGIRYALGAAWLTLVIAETIASRNGIGYMVQNARELLRIDIIIFAILLYALAGWLADWLIRQIEYRVLRWNPAYKKAAGQ